MILLTKAALEFFSVFPSKVSKIGLRRQVLTDFKQPFISRYVIVRSLWKPRASVIMWQLRSFCTPIEISQTFQNRVMTFKVGAYGRLDKNCSRKVSQTFQSYAFFLVGPETMDNAFL